MKLRERNEMLSEAVGMMCEAGFDKAIVKKIAKMTDENDHGGALLAGAKMVGETKLAKIIELIMKIHMLEGSMPYELITYRNNIGKRIDAAAKKKFTSADFDKFQSAY